MTRNDGTLTVRDAKIIFRNFAGEVSQYNPNGHRSFCLLIDDELAEDLKHDGWNVKRLRPLDDGIQRSAYLPVAVSFKRRPPKIVIVSTKGKTPPLEEEDLVSLDHFEYEHIDLVIKPSKWTVGTNSGIKAYLSSFWMRIYEHPLDLEYDAIPEIPRGAIETDIWEGEVVEDNLAIGSEQKAIEASY